MTERPPDIPPWSPLAHRAREGGADTAPWLGPAGTTVVQDEPFVPAPDGEDTAAATSTGGRGARAIWLVAGLLGGIVLALVLAAAIGDDGPAPSPTTVVRAPLPTTSAGAPAAIGTRVAVGNGWTVAVRGADAGATRPLQQLNKDREPLEKGQQYVLIDLEMSYVDGAPDAESPFYGVDLSVVGEDGTVVTPADSPCTAPAPAFDMSTELTRGSSERGRICFAVATDQVASLRLVAEPSMAYGSDPSWFALSAGK